MLQQMRKIEADEM